MRRPAPILLLALAAAACTCQEPPAPVVTAVEPGEAANDVDTDLVIRGAHFLPAVKADLDDPGRSQVNAAFALELVHPDSRRFGLVDPFLVSEVEIRARLPAGASPKIYDLHLADPRGRTAFLPNALLVFAPDCASAGDPCDDGNPCTEGDFCQGRRCRPGTAVTCQALDACHLAGTCDPGSGLCSNPPAPDGAGCNDGNQCTQVDACQGGACVGSIPVACTPLDACHLAGACDPGTGLCSNPVAPDGTGCNDGNPCTQLDACQGGACAGSSPVACTPLDACHLAGACDAGTGLCSNPVAPDGTACQSACLAGETCQVAICTQPPGGCLNTAPLARLAATPLAAATESVVTFDASASSDAEDPPASLTAEFDFDGSGVFSAPLPATLPSSHPYPLPGAYQAWVRVTDSGGLASYAAVLVLVAEVSDLVVVNTAADESDPGATPADPKNTGLSLREAVTWVNLQLTPKTITFAGPMSVVMTGGQRDLTLTAPGAAVVGEPGVTVDFGGFNQACFVLTAPGQRLLGLAIRGCDSVFVDLLPGSQGAQVAYCDIGPAAGALGVDAGAASPPASPPASLIGPGNRIAGVDTGVRVFGTDYAVGGNRIHANVTGIEVFGVRARVSGNAIFGQIVSGPFSGTGLRIFGGTDPVEVWHNVFDGNARDGVESAAVPLDLRNNLFTNNAGYGVRAQTASFAPGRFGWNGFWGNLLGPVLPPLATGPTDVPFDPLYVDRPGGDLRLLPGGPAIDAGFMPPLLDVNGPASGDHNGLAPDLGAEETPYTR
jgi:hypothetical protein